MSGDDFENKIREGMHGAIDPIVPGPNAANRVMDAVTESASHPRRPFAGLAIGQGLGAVLMASVVVILVGGAIGLSLALRGHPGQPLPGPAVTSGATNTPMPTPTPSPIVTPTPSPLGADAAACVGSMLTASFTDFDGAAGSEGGDIALKNTSGAGCTMDGYSNLQGRTGLQVTQLGVTHVQATLINNSNGTMPTVQSFILQAGQTAYVAVEWTDVQSTSTACSTFQTLVITPPSGRGSVTMSTHPLNPPSFMFCASHGAEIWINEAPVSLTRYFSQP
jgi:Protein of unknown function (DUF4232)